MVIKTQVLRDFKTAADNIKPNTINPLLGYLKLEKGILTKNNLIAFVSLNIGGNESFLVDEKILMNLVAFTGSEEITVELQGKSIFITDGIVKITSPTDDLSAYPATSVPETGPVLLPGATLASIMIASNFINEVDSSPFKSHVFCRGLFIGASNSYIMYAEAPTSELPEIMLRKDACRVIGKLEQVEFSANNSYYFFKDGQYNYGFSRTAEQYLDFSKFLQFDNQVTSFKLEKTELVRFNNLCNSSSPSALVFASMEMTMLGLKVDMVDSNYEVNINMVLPAEGDATESFTFNCLEMNKLLQALPDDTLTFYKVQRKYFITGKSNFTALIMGASDATNN